MSFIRCMPRGKKWYVYEITTVWDKVNKKYKQKAVYLGSSTEKNGPYKPKAVSNPKINTGLEIC